MRVGQRQRMPGHGVGWLLVLLFCSGPAWSADPGPGITASVGRIGVVDLVTVTALHPDLAQFDFVRAGFRREAGLPGVASAPDRACIDAELVRVASMIAEIDASRAVLLRESAPPDPGQTVMRERLLADHARRSASATARHNALLWVRENPDLTGPEETRACFARIASEARGAVVAVARAAGVAVVLNRGLPNAPADGWQQRETAEAGGLSWLEQNVLRSLLGSASAAMAKPELPDARMVHTWLAITARPDVQQQLRLQPHPLVLWGGLDLTASAVARLLAARGVATPAIEVICAQVAADARSLGGPGDQ